LRAGFGVQGGDDRHEADEGGFHAHKDERSVPLPASRGNRQGHHRRARWPDRRGERAGWLNDVHGGIAGSRAGRSLSFPGLRGGNVGREQLGYPPDRRRESPKNKCASA
jgi:hypothetical protein